MDTSDTALSSALATLRARYPKGCTIPSEGDVIDRGAVRKLTDLGEFSGIALAPKELVFDLHGSSVAVELRGLTSVESAELDEMKGPKPPKRPAKDDKGRPVVGREEFDFEDEVYRAELSRIYELKRAVIISKGLVGMSVPGSNADELKANLARMFPPHVLDLLKDKILSLTSHDIEIASFS